MKTRNKVFCFFVFWLCLAAAGAEEKPTFQEQVLPLIEANCSKCHNADKKKADLDLTSYPSTLKGSGSGVVVVSGNPDGSKLWKALTHAEEPFMPPNRPKLTDKELEVFKQWIFGGLLEKAGGQAVAAAKPGLDLALNADALAKPEGPPPMPRDLPCDPVVHTRSMNAITGLAGSPWAPVVALAGQKQVLLFNTDTFEPLGVLPFGECQPVELKFSRSGKLLLASGGIGAKLGRLVLWDVLTGEPLAVLDNESDTILAADIRPDQSQIAFGGPNRLVKIFSLKAAEVQFKIKKHTDWVTAVAFSPNGQILATADRNGGVSLWDPDNGQELFTLPGHKSAVTSLSWRGDSKILASSSEDGTVKLWETKEGKRVKNWKAHAAGTLCVAYAQDGKLATCGRDNAITLWDSNGSKVRSFEFFGNIPIRVSFNQDGTRITGTDFAGRVALWNCADGKRLGELDPNPPLLADQIAEAKRCLTQIDNRQRDIAREISGQTAQPDCDSARITARATLNRLQALQVLSYAYHLREALGATRKISSNPDSEQARLNRLLNYYHDLLKN